MSKNYSKCEKIAILSDVHGLLEPLEAVIQDAHNRGITEIISLGDNVVLGPNPNEVMKLITDNNIKCIAGNAEEYLTLGIAPFMVYFDYRKEQGVIWTKSKLNSEYIKNMELYPHSIDLVAGDKKIALCHFANDVRCDYGYRDNLTYQGNVLYHNGGFKQFYYTNSDEQKEEIEMVLKTFNKFHICDELKGYESTKKDPLFAGKRVTDYDAIIQGHVHFKLYESDGKTEYYTIRSAGSAYGEEGRNMASYIILTINDCGYDVEEVYVPFDRKKMVHSILTSDNPDKIIEKYTSITVQERVLVLRN